ncbi:hypothetical protein Agub_g110, partial [Astrephomene gubernaculifera]
RAGDQEQQQGQGSGGASAAEGIVAAACRSDRVVEALLGAFQALLERCPQSDTDSPPPPSSSSSTSSPPPASSYERQLAALQHLAPLLQLPREAAAEELHLAVQRCLATALEPLAAAAAATSAPQAAPEQSDISSSSSSRRGAACATVAAPLCGAEAVSLAGYLVHCCLEGAEREVLAGHKGSKALCAACLTSLRLLLAALPHPDTLAFFLPGVVSGLSKQLFAAGTAIGRSGPSAPPGASATAQALICLCQAAVTVL